LGDKEYCQYFFFDAGGCGPAAALDGAGPSWLKTEDFQRIAARPLPWQ
jgi:hypothetical protein